MSAPGGKAKIYIVFYSTYGHVEKLAEAVARGAEEAGAEVKLWQIPETLPKEVLEKMFAPPKSAVPVISPNDLADADGIIFGVPTRFGSPAAQFKALFDATGGLWGKGALVGKVASIFFSTATLGGGQETTALTAITNFVHHGMIYVPIGYGNPALFNLEELHGGSPYGAGTLAGPKGERTPSKLELSVAEYQGKHVATITSQLKRGREAAAPAAAAAGATPAATTVAAKK